MATDSRPASIAGSHVDASADLIAAISTAPEGFLTPSDALNLAAILAAKGLLDPLANDIVDAQTQKRRQIKRKRKREDSETGEQVLQLRQIHINGFGPRQIWEQGRRVLEAACREVENDLEAHQALIPEQDEIENGNGSDHQLNGEVGEHSDAYSDMEFDEAQDDLDDSLDDEEEMLDAEEDDSEADKKHFNRPSETYTTDPNGLNDGFFSIDDFNRQTSFLEQQDARGDDDNPSDEDEVDWDAAPVNTAARTKPLAKSSRSKAAQDDDAESEEDDGPTFGNADLDASDDEDDNDDDDVDDGGMGLDNTNDIMYKDFFEPPPSKQGKGNRKRALPKTQPPIRLSRDNEDGDELEDELEADIQRAVSDVRRDIFESEEELSSADEERDDDDNDDDSDEQVLSKSRPKPTPKKSSTATNLSTHEKQQAKIAQEIKRLEAQNVSRKPWQLMGEARAPDRPINSLIEEDLDFERTGKPVPVVTAAVSEDIEALIKRRILNREFDEVLRRRPDAASLAAGNTRRGLLDPSNTLAQSIDNDSQPSLRPGLSSLYEQQQLRAMDPNFTDERDNATKRKHAEIDKLWKEVETSLNALTNLHFKPRKPEIEIKTVEDKGVIGMQDSRPVGGDDGGVGAVLAPQEIYRAGGGGKTKGASGGRRDGGDGVMTGRSGIGVNKEEMSREERKRRRQREKGRIKKGKINQGTLPNSDLAGARKAGAATDVVDGSKKLPRRKKGDDKEKQDIISQLKRGGVRVIGKGGQVSAIDGRLGTGADSGLGDAVAGIGGLSGGAALKL